MGIFNERIRRLREEKGISQKMAAEELGITPQSLSYYEKGREANYDLLKKIAKYYGVSVDYLVGTIDTRMALDNDMQDRTGVLVETIDQLEKLKANDISDVSDFMNKYMSEEYIDDFVKLCIDIKAYDTSKMFRAEFCEIHLKNTIDELNNSIDRLCGKMADADRAELNLIKENIKLWYENSNLIQKTDEVEKLYKIITSFKELVK